MSLSEKPVIRIDFVFTEVARYEEGQSSHFKGALVSDRQQGNGAARVVASDMSASWFLA